MQLYGTYKIIKNPGMPAFTGSTPGDIMPVKEGIGFIIVFINSGMDLMEMERVLFLALALTGISLPFSAAAMGDMNFVRQEQAAQERERETFRNRLFQDTLKPIETEEKSGEMPPVPSVSFYVKQVVLDNPSEELSFLNDMASQSTGHNMTAGDVERLVSRMNSKLMDKGYITSRVMVPEQNLSGVSRDLEHSDVLTAKVRELSRNLKPGEKKYFYSSMDFNGVKKGIYPTKDQKLAYGKVKLAINIEEDAEGNIVYKGEVGDTYNFEWHRINQSNYKNEHIKLIMNNGAVIYQEIGALQPFNWTASIEGYIRRGNKI